MIRICRPVYHVISSTLRPALKPLWSPTFHRLWYTTQNTLDSTDSWSAPTDPNFIEGKKHPSRGGQNLSDRFTRLERSHRGKRGYEKDISDLEQDAGGSILDVSSKETQQRLKQHRQPPKTFMGFVVPEEPQPPAEDECCMSGCAICVYDLYQEALDDYMKSVDSLRTSLRALGIPQSKWPEKIRTLQARKEASEVKKNVSLSAFEEFERQMKMKQEKQAQTQAQTQNAPAPVAKEDASRQGPNWQEAPSRMPKLNSFPPRLTSRRRGRSKSKLPTVAEMFEGLGWLVFSNR